MAIMLEGYTNEEQRSVVPFLRPKGFNANGTHKEMFRIYGGECLSRKAIHKWVEKFSQGSSKIAGDARPGRCVVTVIKAAVLRQQSK
jgi:hypothetical protein